MHTWRLPPKRDVVITSLCSSEDLAVSSYLRSDRDLGKTGAMKPPVPFSKVSGQEFGKVPLMKAEGLWGPRGFLGLGAVKACLERQVAQNKRPLYPKVAHS